MGENKINKNMLRDRSFKLPEVTKEMLKECNIENLDICQEFLDVNAQLSSETKKQYISATNQFIYWVHTSLNDKPWNKITKRDFMRYMSYLMNRGMSSSGLKLKKSSVSTVNTYIENVVAESEESFKTFRNFTKGLGQISKNQVYQKIAISEEEYKILIKTLRDDENYLGCAWVSTMFSVGCRRSGCIQFKTEILNYPIEEGGYITAHVVREKGMAGGKFVQYLIPQEALKYIRLWIEKRGYESEFIFTTKYGGEIKKMSKEWGDTFCADVLSDILNRRINVHLFKSSCITALLKQGVDIQFVSKYVAMHENISTTSIYDLRTFDEEKKSLFSNMVVSDFKVDEEIDDEDDDLEDDIDEL